MALITSAQAARRLGVKVETLYAYVSRGLLERHGVDGARHSLFDADEVERLARRGRPRAATRTGPLLLDIETAITSVAPDGHRYRGRSAIDLAGRWTFEQTAEWLWTGREAPATTHWDVPEWASAMEVDRSVATVRIPAVVAAGAVGASDPPGDGRGDPEAVAASARGLLGAVVDRLPERRGAVATLELDDGTKVAGSLAGRLWGRLSARRPNPRQVAAVNAALVLMADHELATSTLAARVAASTRAAPAAVVLAGLGALAGPLHGGESTRAAEVLDVVAADGPGDAVAFALDRHGRVPGFGHRLYPDGDPRAVALIQQVRRTEVGARQVEAYEALARHGTPRFGHPNCDLALAALVCSQGFDPWAGELIFTVARMAGWLAHAIEEYGEAPLRFRPRATYVGD